jgi:hypothetical protein
MHAHPRRQATLTAPPGRRRADARGTKPRCSGHYPIHRGKAPAARQQKSGELNQPAAKTTAERNRLNRRGQRGLQAFRTCQSGQPLPRLPYVGSRSPRARRRGPQPARPATH